MPYNMCWYLFNSRAEVLIVRSRRCHGRFYVWQLFWNSFFFFLFLWKHKHSKSSRRENHWVLSSLPTIPSLSSLYLCWRCYSSSDCRNSKAACQAEYHYQLPAWLRCTLIFAESPSATALIISNGKLFMHLSPQYLTSAGI